jgi:hypothetical protein
MRDPHSQLTTLAGKNTEATSKSPEGMPVSIAEHKPNTPSPHKNGITIVQKQDRKSVAFENAMAEAANFCHRNRPFARAALTAGKSRGLR